MDRKDLTATSWFTSKLTVFVLVVIGVFFVFQPPWLGFRALAELVGGADRVLSAGLGAAFFLLAALSHEKEQIRVRGAEMMEALHQLLYGKDYARDREAIDILMRSLESADARTREIAFENLARLTGQSFAADPKVWRSWWAAHQKTWSRK